MTSDQQSPPPKPSGLSAFWAELKRRKVMRVAITYAVVAWLIIQVANATFAEFGIPLWAYRFVVIMLLCFFPVAIILAWAFELTPDGIKTTKTAQAEQGDAPVSEKQQRKRNWFTFLFGAAVPTVIFGTLALFFYIRSGGGGEAEVGEKSIAVLPLENMSPDPENAFFADGVQEDILSNLSKVNELLVIGRRSTLQYRDTIKTLKQIGNELGVRYLVQGSVQRAGNQVRVRVQLIDALTEGQIWDGNYNKALDDIFAIQAEVAMEIAGKLRAVISPEEIEQIELRPTENQEAYDYYIRSRSYEIPQSERMLLLEKAVDLDPNLYEAWGRIAHGSIINWNTRRYRLDSEIHSKAQLAFKELKRLAPNSPEVHRVQSYFSYSEEDDLELALEHALKARMQGQASVVGWRYLQLGQLDEAKLYIEDGFRREPFFPSGPVRLFLIYTLKEMWAEAEALIQRNLNLYADHELSDRLLFWKDMASYLEFLKTGDKEAYNFEVDHNLTNPDPSREFLSSLFHRKLTESLKSIEDYDSKGVSLTWGGQYVSSLMVLYLEPLKLVKSLINFELNEKEEWLENAQEAKDQFERIVEGYPKVKPNHLAALAICYALESNREKVEATIPKIRELTENVNWRFREQASCEMRIAIAYLVLGDHDKAIETLEAASKMDSPIFLNRELDLWFIFDRLRGDPRFDALLED